MRNKTSPSPPHVSEGGATAPPPKAGRGVWVNLGSREKCMREVFFVHNFSIEICQTEA